MNVSEELKFLISKHKLPFYLFTTETETEVKIRKISKISKDNR